MAKRIRVLAKARNYVPMSQLGWSDQAAVGERYPHKVPWIPDSLYLYPVDKHGCLTSGRRQSPPHEEAVRLKAEYDVREVMES